MHAAADVVEETGEGKFGGVADGLERLGNGTLELPRASFEIEVKVGDDIYNLEPEIAVGDEVTLYVRVQIAEGSREFIEGGLAGCVQDATPFLTGKDIANVIVFCDVHAL